MPIGQGVLAPVCIAIISDDGEDACGRLVFQPFAGIPRGNVGALGKLGGGGRRLSECGVKAQLIPDIHVQ
jgi:hypothetical protein